MTISGKVTQLRHIRKMKKGGDLHTVLDEERHILPVPGSVIPGEAVIQTQTDEADMYGTPIGTGPVIWDSKSGVPIAFSNSFQCSECHFHLGLGYAKELDQDPSSLPPELDSVNMLGKASAHAKTGVCKECWEKAKWKRMWKALVKFILGPFLPEEPETKPAPQPVVVVFAAQPQHPPTNTAPVHPMNIPSAPPTGKPSSGSSPFSSIPILVLAASIHVVSPIVVHATPPLHPVATSSGDTAMRQSTPSPQEVVAALLQQARLLGLNDPTISVRGAQLCQRIERDAATGVIDPRTFQDLANLVQRAGTVLQPQLFRAAFPTIPPPDRIQGRDIAVYRLLDGSPCTFMLQEFLEQFRIIGRSGATKSTAASHYLNAVVEAGGSALIIDSKGRGDFDFLCRNHPGRVLKAVVGTHAFFNPWQYWRRMETYFLRIFDRKDSEIALIESIDLNRRYVQATGGFAVTHRGIFDRIPDVRAQPGFPRIRQDLKASMLIPLTMIQRSALYPSIRCQRGWDLGEVMRKGFSLIVDTNSIAGTPIEHWLIVSLLVAVQQEIEASPVLNFKTAPACTFYVDECTSFTLSRRDVSDLPPLVHLSTLTRAANLALCLCYHSPRNVHPVLHSAYFLLVCSLSNGEDIETVRRACFLTPEQAKALASLPKGVAIMRMADRWTEPFVVSYEAIPLFQRLTPADTDLNNAAALSQLPTVLPENFASAVSAHQPAPPPSQPARAPATPPPSANSAQSAVQQRPGPAHVPRVRQTASVVSPSSPTCSASPPSSLASTQNVTPPPASSTRALAQVSADSLAVLSDLWHADRAFLNLTQRAATLRLPSGRTLTFRSLAAMLDDLASLGMCEPTEVQLGPRHSSTLHYLTSAGHRVIGSAYVPVRGDFRHDLGKRLFRYMLSRKGIVATLEARMPGSNKPVDVGFACSVNNMPASVAGEVPTSTFSVEPDQACRDLQEGWNYCIEFCLNRDDYTRLCSAFRTASMPADPRIVAVLPVDIDKAQSIGAIVSDTALQVCT